MPRGQLIFPYLVDIAQLDTAATAADPDAAGPLTSGYDPDFREPVLVPPVSGSASAPVRRVETLVQLYAQIETEEEGRLQMMVGGVSPQSRRVLIFHFVDLEAVGMVDATSGRAKLRAPGDRLVAIRNPDTHELIETIPDNPGFWAISVESIGWGMGPDRNLLKVIFEDRALSVESARG
jgi:hypothetical protein